MSQHPATREVKAGQAASRLAGLDLARGLAYFGMVFVNFRTMISGPEEGSGWLSWLSARLDGRAAATFVVVAGIGISFMAARARASNDPAKLRAVRSTILRRAGFLFAAGLIFWQVWLADILHYYGAYLAAGALLLSATGKHLGVWIVGLPLLFAAMLVGGVDYDISWNWKSLTYDDLWAPSSFFRNLLYNGFHPVIPWLAFLVFGMWLGRRDLRLGRTRLHLAAAGLVIAAFAELGSRLLMSWAIHRFGPDDAHAVFGTEPMPPMPLYMAAAGGTSVVVVMLSLWAAEQSKLTRWISPLIAVGQLALTLYVAHVVLVIIPLEFTGVLDGRRTVETATLVALGFCVLSSVFAWSWRRRYARGPLEWLMRWTTRTQ